MGVQLPGHKPLLAHEVDGDEFVRASARETRSASPGLSMDTMTIEWVSTLRSRRTPRYSAPSLNAARR